VWNLGEYPEEYEHGRLRGAPDTWIAGLSRARAGVLMLADPRVGTPSYLQGWAPDIEFADRARVLRTGVRSCVPVHGDVLVRTVGSRRARRSPAQVLCARRRKSGSAPPATARPRSSSGTCAT
jgi:hypothetical protein